MLDRQASAVATHTLAVIVHPAFSHTLPEVPLALSFWEACCDAVLGKIAAGLDARSLAAMEMVSTRCRRVAADEDRWRALCIERFNTPPTALDSMHEVATWKEIYRWVPRCADVAGRRAEAGLRPGRRRLTAPLPPRCCRRQVQPRGIQVPAGADGGRGDAQAGLGARQRRRLHTQQHGGGVMRARCSWRHQQRARRT